MAVTRYADRAVDDLAEIWLYYAENGNVDLARRMLRKIRSSVRQMLVRFPRSGPTRQEFGVGIRSYPVLPYVIFYVADDEGVLVLRVLHGHRDIQAALMSLLTAV